MLISLHEQGTTTPKIRAAIRASDKPASLVTRAASPRFSHSSKSVAIRHCAKHKVGLTATAAAKPPTVRSFVRWMQQRMVK